MGSGITEAMATLRPDSQRQIVLVTDGQIGFEDQVIADLTERLPRGTRLHTVGVGSAVNRALTAPAARAGRGVEVIVGLGEDPERAAHRVVARTALPLVVDVALEGSALLEHAPARLGDLFAGAPLLVSARVRPSGGTLRLCGRTVDGPWEARLTIPEVAPSNGNAAVVALFGREKVEDLELVRTAQPAGAVDEQIERIGLELSIATRLTSWVAVSETAAVDPRDPIRRERIPQALPYGMSVAGLGLRKSGPLPRSMATVARACRGPVGGFEDGIPAFTRRARRGPATGKGFGARLDECAEPVGTPISGRVVSWKDGVAVVEIVADADGLAWDPAAVLDVVLLTEEGESAAVTVDINRTTRAVALQEGECVRLVLCVQNVTLGWVDRVVFQLGVQVFVVGLSA